MPDSVLADQLAVISPVFKRETQGLREVEVFALLSVPLPLKSIE